MHFVLCNLVWNHMRDFKTKDWSASLICNNKYDFRPQLLSMKSNYHLITSILRSQNSAVSWIQDFSVCIIRYFIDPVLSSRFLKVAKAFTNFHVIWLVVVKWFRIAFLLARKNMQFRAKKISQFVNKLHQWRPIRLQGSLVILKWM